MPRAEMILMLSPRDSWAICVVFASGAVHVWSAGEIERVPTVLRSIGRSLPIAARDCARTRVSTANTNFRSYPAACGRVTMGHGTDEALARVTDDSAEILPPAEQVARSIRSLRGLRVILDFDLARLYGVEARTLLQAVKRNAERFPPDFMIQLDKQEVTRLRSQIVISKGRGGRRYPPHAFTEQGVAMLSSVLRSKRAVIKSRIASKTTLN